MFSKVFVAALSAVVLSACGAARQPIMHPLQQDMATLVVENRLLEDVKVYVGGRPAWVSSGRTECIHFYPKGGDRKQEVKYVAFLSGAVGYEVLDLNHSLNWQADAIVRMNRYVSTGLDPQRSPCLKR